MENELKACNYKDCPDYNEGQNENCRLFESPILGGAKCQIFIAYNKFKVREAELEGSIKELISELRSIGFWELTSDAEQIYAVIDKAETLLKGK